MFGAKGNNSGQISLEKRTASAEISLIKALQVNLNKGNDLGEVSAQVIVAIDFSLSMSDRYANGEVQATVERGLGLVLAGLDDDGTVQVFFFDHQAYGVKTVDATNYLGFVDNWRRGRRMGGTNYTPVMYNIVQFAEQNGMTAPGKPPVFVLFVTDGEPGDRQQTVDFLVQVAGKPFFWQFLGLGYSPSFLERLDTMPGRIIDNVGLTAMQRTENMPDEAWYDDVMSEFLGSWLNQARRQGIISV